MRWIVIIVLIGGVLLWKQFQQIQDQQSILGSKASFAAQRNALLMFEKQIECKAHSLCLDATLDGKGRLEPANALRQCTAALKLQDQVMVPEAIPQRIRDRLEEFKQLLHMDTQRSIERAKYDMEAPLLYSVPPTKKGHPDSAAYVVIGKINKAYDLQMVMDGQYINCSEIP